VFFHFDIGIEVLIKDNSVITQCGDGNNIELTFISDSMISLICSDELVSKAYGTAVLAKTINVEAVSSCPFMLETKIKRIN
jgi:hypothetical protein